MSITISQMKGFVKATSVNLEFDQFKDFIVKNNWSPFLFEKEYRNIENSKGTDVLVLDIDDGCLITDAIEMFKNFKHVIGTTRSHQLEKKGKVADRFRVILFMSKKIVDKNEYDNFWSGIQKLYPFIDSKCKSFAHSYFACKEIVSSNLTGDMIEINEEKHNGK